MMETVPSGTILNGRYRIERVLGSGGFGHVYLAIDLRTNQQYAIKEYFVTGASGQAQLQHEARVLSQLHHPNLPAFQEAFDERGHYFVVLSYIEGSDLTDLIRNARRSNEPIPLARIMGWMLSVCDAVQSLHGAGSQAARSPSATRPNRFSPHRSGKPSSTAGPRDPAPPPRLNRRGTLCSGLRGPCRGAGGA